MNEAILAVAASVAMHVAWNLIARRQPGDAFPLWWVLLTHLILLGPIGFPALITSVTWTFSFTLLLITSATANVIYFWGLRKAYEHAPVALVYPLVRSSPLLIALWSVLLTGESLSANAWLGIGISAFGLWLLSWSALRNAHDRKALPWAVVAMLATSVYSLSDKSATGSIPGFAGLIGFISVGYLAAWLSISWELKRKTGRWLPEKRIDVRAMFVGGLCIGTAYALVIQAMRTLPAAEVVTYTNAGIVIASILSVTWFKEQQDWKRRLIGASVVAFGLVVTGCKW
ncbi:EamA family transporter [Dechloromonas agitata]|uniref:EamA family transporter n=1 Tax=Dechloromonas agitata TaxID=73030 RepID=UPI0004899826|nr:EamA family transporter [Dechloromonas agitata]